MPTKTKAKVRKISDWLSDFSGHSAIDVRLAKIAYEKETGRDWPRNIKGRPVQQLLKEGREHYKGLQVWNGRTDARVVAGWSLASAITHTYLPKFWPVSDGRGSMFAEYLDALIKAGL
jgi:hypothetical protein